MRGLSKMNFQDIWNSSTGVIRNRAGSPLWLVLVILLGTFLWTHCAAVQWVNSYTIVFLAAISAQKVYWGKQMIKCGYFQNARDGRILAVAMKISDLVMFVEVDLVIGPTQHQHMIKSSEIIQLPGSARTQERHLFWCWKQIGASKFTGPAWITHEDFRFSDVRQHDKKQWNN